MKVEVNRSQIRGYVKAPASKSAMQRILAGTLLADGSSEILSPSFCDDSLAVIEIIRGLGAEVTISEERVLVKGGFNPYTREIFCGESGLATRMFTPIAALHNKPVRISGKGSILKRPVDMVVLPLAGMGVDVESTDGFLPLVVKGPLKGGNIIADGSVSSQFITGLLMALPVVDEDSILTVENLVSKPYIDLTVSLLSEFGIEIVNNAYRNFKIPGRQKYRAGSYNVEGDWSGAAFLMVMGALSGPVEIKGLNLASTQADKSIYYALSLAGARIRQTSSGIIVKAGRLKGFEFDISDCPDLAPPLAVLALACKGKTVLRGTGRLVAKESNRSRALHETLSILGANITSGENTIEIEGGVELKGGTVNSFNDHRIAMANAVAALLCRETVIIEEMESINKSYPGFIDDFLSLGGNIRII